MWKCGELGNVEIRKCENEKNEKIKECGNVKMKGMC
jgi:hypothetical protein